MQKNIWKKQTNTTSRELKIIIEFKLVTMSLALYWVIAYWKHQSSSITEVKKHVPVLEIEWKTASENPL